MIVISIGLYLTMTIIGAIIGLPLILIGFIIMLIAIFAPSNLPKIIVGAPPRKTTSTKKMQTIDAQLQCSECHKWNPINAEYCKTCGSKIS
jgi:hypothetical protein